MVNLEVSSSHTALTNASVESDYTVVFFAAGGRHRPGWDWVWKAYRSLSRKYRKNLKRLVSLFHQIKSIAGRMWQLVATVCISVYGLHFHLHIRRLFMHI